VLRLCAQAGMASLALIAIGGTKIGSDAALDKNRTDIWIRAEIDKILADAAEDQETQLLDPDTLPVALRRQSSPVASSASKQRWKGPS